MTALGLMFIGFGLLTAWCGFDRTIVFTVLRSLLGAPVNPHDEYGAPKDAKTQIA